MPRVPLPLGPGLGLSCRRQFRGPDVDGGLWKVERAAAMVEIQVGQHDMADIGRIEPQSPHLIDGRLPLAWLQAEHGRHGAA